MITLYIHKEISEMLLLSKRSKVFGNEGNRFLEVSTIPNFIQRDKEKEKQVNLSSGQK